MADDEHSYLLEFTRVGPQVRVTACDSETGIEAVVITPANTTRKAMTDLAVRKLKYLLKKKAKGN